MTSTAHDLRALVHERLGDAQVVVVSNREPYVHSHAGDEIVCQVLAGGLVTALDPVMRACGGTWVAHGAGDADRAVVDGRDRVLVPPPDGPASRDRYRLKRVWLSKAEEQDTPKLTLGRTGRRYRVRNSGRRLLTMVSDVCDGVVCHSNQSVVGQRPSRAPGPPARGV